MSNERQNDTNNFFDELGMTKDVPTTPIFRAAFATITGPGQSEDMAKRYLKNAREATHRSKDEVKVRTTKDGQIRIEQKAGEAYSVVEIPDPLLLSKNSYAAAKIFTYILNKALERGISSKTEKELSVEFPLMDLVEDGLYADTRSARRAFIEGMNVLMTLRTNGELYLARSGKTLANNVQRTPDKDIARVMFVGRDITKNTCKVLFNPSMNWDYFLYFYTALPVWAFQLSKRAFSLIYYIFAHMRINVRNIDKENRISYKTVQYWLNLPHKDETDTPKKEIIKPITDAIKDIKYAHDEYKRQCMEELEAQKKEQTTEEGRQRVEKMIQKHIEMFDKPDFDIIAETPDATTNDILSKGKIKIILNDPYKTKLQQILHKGSGLLSHSKAVKDDTED